MLTHISNINNVSSKLINNTEKQHCSDINSWFLEGNQLKKGEQTTGPFIDHFGCYILLILLIFYVHVDL